MDDRRQLTIDGGDVTLYAEVRGDGPRLLFFNGSGATLASSALLIDVLAQHFTVAAADQRGLGRTGLPRDESGFTMANYARDGATLLDALGWPTARVLGVSFGGMVAQEFAVTYPQRVERLVLACTSSGGAGGSSYPLHELEALDPATRAARMTTIADTRYTPGYLAAHPKAQRQIEEMRAATAAVEAALSDDERRGRSWQLAARKYHDTFDRLDRINCPTLVAGGRYDGLAPVANSEALARAIANAELQLFEGGHMFFLQDRAALPAVFSFLES